MTSLLRLPPRQASAFTSLRRAALSPAIRRNYAQDSSKPEDKDGASQQNGSADSVNYPIPSNKAHPTVRAGKQSPVADMEGRVREDLPEDVKRHNAEMKQRYDRPYNHISDEGNVGKTWNRK
ncbi:uncharacterized protein N7459_004271 [Penicillium hispanicum]|uniref:uncharacterized protein n=1 Tax=Penicillium hispanicum TaxID=1080232 RepID=UPI002542496D|nr:uncharacterized protein N7459_004271 [Penicillium hispanicum]KAJ5584471.1 hypothetical protein N7459_004271 [Penicillium hispanicum]